VMTLPQSATPTTAQESLDNWWRGAIGANQTSLTGKGVKIAILDTGCGYFTDTGVTFHADLYANIASIANFASKDSSGNPADVDPNDVYDVNGHGTHVAGIAAGNGSASNGKYEGIAPAASLFIGKVLNDSGSGDLGDIIRGIEWAVDNKVNIISMSLGVSGVDSFGPEAYAMQNATQLGTLVVAAGGNDGPEYYTSDFPGSAPYALAVAASDSNNKIADFSSSGPTFAMQAFPSVAAPGVDIIAPLSSGSSIDLEESYYGNTITGTGGNNYVALSGTSMATPMVAGAAALLLQQYPTLNPYALRVALMESATPLGDSVERQGTGLVNVPQALSFLGKISSNVNNVTSVYPKALPFDPYDLLQFPGDTQTMNLTVLSGGVVQNVYAQVPTIPGVIITNSSSPINFPSQGGLKLWNLTIEIEWNATAGQQTGIINFTDSSGTVLAQTTLSLTITLPKARVYFDSFHGANDYLNALPYGTSEIEFYQLAKAFAAKNYSVTLSMENWTPNYIADRDGRILTPEILRNYDAVVLETPFMPYTPTEIQALADFRKNGGSILVISDRYQFLTVDSLNSLFGALGSGISIQQKNLEYFLYYGLYSLAGIFSVNTSTSTDQQLLAGVKQLQFLWGCSLTTTGGAVSVLTEPQTRDTIIAREDGSNGAGNLVVLSGPSFVTNPYMLDPVQGSNNTRLVNNIINYLLPPKTVGFNIARAVIPDEAQNVTDRGAYWYVTDGMTGLPVENLNNGTNITVTASNSSLTGGAVMNVTLTGQVGVYANTSLTFSANSTFPYFLNASVTYNGETQNVTGMAVQTDDSVPIIATNWQSTDSITRALDASGQLTLYLQNSSSASTVQVFGGSVAISVFNGKKQYSFSQGSSYIPASGNYETQMNARGETSGLYAYFYEVNSSTGYSNIYSNRTAFIVVNFDPIINKTGSFFDDTSFDSMESGNSLIVQSVAQLDTVSFEVAANDGAAYEDDPSNLTGIVAFFPAYVLNDTIGVIIGDGQLPEVSLVFDPASGTLQGSFQIPQTLTFNLGNKNVTRDTTTNSTYYALFEVAVRDSEGGMDDYNIILQVTSGGIDWTPFIILILIAVAVVVVIFILYKRKQRQTQPAYLSPYESGRTSYPGEGPQWTNASGTPPGGFDYDSERLGPRPPPGGGQPGVGSQSSLKKFCPYCGQPISISAQFCPFCGKTLPEGNFF
ncbi:MAG TPA: S8 family serine peptidase, partial [Candidatus Lokiarchaeia archaeon]|nr:S8 family serine peptidase [Candidatus Lokiarchaeia archaeon]